MFAGNIPIGKAHGQYKFASTKSKVLSGILMQRQRFHDLPESLKAIVKEIGHSPNPISPISAARKYRGQIIKRLIETGHLSPSSYQGKEFLIISALTAKEIEGRQPWTDADDNRLRELWAQGDALNSIATEMRRQPGLILTRVHRLRIERTLDGARFMSSVMAWQVRRHRAALIEAERRGLDITDSGQGMFWHRALLRRFHNARMLAVAPLEEDVPRWTATEQTALRKYRDRMLSVCRSAWLLDRSPSDVARRLIIEGRFVNGHWTDREDNAISRGLRLGYRVSTIAARLKHRSTHDVKARIAQLFPKGRKGYTLWSRAEVQRLIDLHIAGYRGEALTSRLPSRGHHAVRRLLYGVLKETREGKDWEPADINILTRAMIRRESLEDVSKWLGRDVESVRPIYEFKNRRRGGRGVSVSPEQARKAVKILKGQKTTQAAVAAQLGVSRPALYRAIRRLRDESGTIDG